MRYTKQVCAAAIAVVVGVLPIAAPIAGDSSVSVPAAHAQQAGTVRVDLQKSVGQDWFASIGDRTVSVRRIDGIDPLTSAGQKALAELDVPARTLAGEEFPLVASTSTSGGQAQFDGLGVGVYLLSVADNPAAADRRVSYAPTVVVITPDHANQDVAPKPQVLGIHTGSRTTCTVPGYIDATSPGFSVDYLYSASVPNPSTDGTIGVFDLRVEFSRGHTVTWTEDLHITPVAVDSQQQASVQQARLGRVTLTGAGEPTDLQEGADFTVLHDATSLRISLTDHGRAKAAELRSVDSRAAVELFVPARTNLQGPWGSVARADTLGTLDTQATLRTDGMDALRTPVEVSAATHVRVVSREACFGPSGAPDTSGGSENVSYDSRPPTHGTDNPQGSQDSRKGLASTGASVLGAVVLGVGLILLGIILRRRNTEEHAN